MSLKEYRHKRKFDSTPEPKPSIKPLRGKGPLRFVVQKHAASRTHYDFRLELDGALKSWAVPKGPSMTSQDPRLAIQVEDHPLEYGSFEGAIPRGNYGAGTVMIWDSGSYMERNAKTRKESEDALRKGLPNGHITFVLSGKKLRGEFALVRLKKKGAPDNAWLLIKKHDSEATRVDVLRQDRSTASDRSLEEIASQAQRKGEIWLPGKGRQNKSYKQREKFKNLSVRPKVEKKTKQNFLPRNLKTMDPVFGPPPSKEIGWLYEEFGRGPRAIAEVEPGRVRIYSRARLPFEKKYPVLVQALKNLGVSAVFDGEIVPEGKNKIYVVSDLLFYEGKDLRERPLGERKKMLSRVPLRGPLRLVEQYSKLSEVKPSPPSAVVAKRLDSIYRGGISRDWLRLRGNVQGADTPLSETPPLTHLDKIFWPNEGYTKGDLAKYYESVSEVILPHLVDRPQSLHRQPDGLRNEGFFHKDMTGFLPKRIQTERIFSSSAGRTINYVLCQDLWALLYLVNLGCIELNPWLSRRQNLERPDMVVIDLDPDDNDFNDVVKVAREVYRVLKAIKVESFCKTSGASGLHICVPTGGHYDYEVGRTFAESLCRIVHQRFPKLTSVERNPAKRRGRIYLDFLQNRRGQTLAAPYCVRPRPQATVSAPLKWSEVKPGLTPDRFTIKTMARRISRVGDLWKPLLNSSVNLEAAMKRLSRFSHN